MQIIEHNPLGSALTAPIFALEMLRLVLADPMCCARFIDHGLCELQATSVDWLARGMPFR